MNEEKLNDLTNKTYSLILR